MSCIVRRHTVKSLSGRAVEDVDSHHHRLSPEDSRHSPLLEEGPSHPHNRLITPLHDTILLRAVRRRVVTLNTFIRAVRHEFAIVIDAQPAQATQRMQEGRRGGRVVVHRHAETGARYAS
jgi:hypothetical protein